MGKHELAEGAGCFPWLFLSALLGSSHTALPTFLTAPAARAAPAAPLHLTNAAGARPLRYGEWAPAANPAGCARWTSSLRQWSGWRPWRVLPQQAPAAQAVATLGPGPSRPTPHSGLPAGKWLLACMCICLCLPNRGVLACRLCLFLLYTAPSLSGGYSPLHGTAAGTPSRRARMTLPRSAWLSHWWMGGWGCWASEGGASATRGRGAPPGRHWRQEVRCSPGCQHLVMSLWLLRHPHRQHASFPPAASQALTRGRTFFSVCAATRCARCACCADFRAVAIGSWGQSVLLGDGEGMLVHWDTGVCGGGSGVWAAGSLWLARAGSGQRAGRGWGGWTGELGIASRSLASIALLPDPGPHFDARCRERAVRPAGHRRRQGAPHQHRPAAGRGPLPRRPVRQAGQWQLLSGTGPGGGGGGGGPPPPPHAPLSGLCWCCMHWWRSLPLMRCIAVRHLLPPPVQCKPAWRCCLPTALLLPLI